MVNESDYIALLDKMIRYCSYSERCLKDVENKLYKLKASTQFKEKVVNELVDSGLVDDLRYAQTFVLSKLRYNKWGRIKIAAYLRSRSIPSHTIDSALNQIDMDEYSQVLEEVLRTKQRQSSVSGDNNKLVRFAQSKGFELGLILDILNNRINAFNK